MLTFVYKMFQGQKKSYLIVLSILTILASFDFAFMSIYSTFNYAESAGYAGMVFRAIPSLGIGISFFISILINNYFVESKNEEFSLILLSGQNMKGTMKYILIQYCLLFFIAFLIGIGGGYLIILAMNSSLGTQSFIIDFSIIIPLLFATFLTKMLLVLLLNYGKFVRIKMNIANYINHSVITSKSYNYFSANTIKKGKLPIGGILYSLFSIAILIISLTEMISSTRFDNLAIWFALSLIAEIGIINTCIPLLFDIIHDSIILGSHKLLISMSDFIDLSHQLASMININAIIIPIIFILILIQGNNILLQTVIFHCYILLMIMVFLSFVIRYSLYLPVQSQKIATLKALGYSYQTQRKIFHQKMVFFIIIVVLFPIFLYGVVLIRCLNAGLISAFLVYFFIAFYIILYMILILFMYYVSFKQLKEVYADVKYLNRGE